MSRPRPARNSAGNDSPHTFTVRRDEAAAGALTRAQVVWGSAVLPRPYLKYGAPIVAHN